MRYKIAAGQPTNHVVTKRFYGHDENNASVEVVKFWVHCVVTRHPTCVSHMQRSMYPVAAQNIAGSAIYITITITLKSNLSLLFGDALRQYL